MQGSIFSLRHVPIWGSLLIILALVRVPIGNAQTQCTGLNLDLGLGLVGSPTSTPLVSTLDIDVVNQGDDVQGWTLGVGIPPGLSVVSVDPSTGCTILTNALFCTPLDPLFEGATFSITVELASFEPGLFTVDASVSGATGTSTGSCFNETNVSFISDNTANNCAEACAFAEGDIVNGKIVRKVTPGNPNINGTNEDEILCGDDRKNKLVGNGGNDILCGFGDNDKLDGGPGNDGVFGNSGDDKLKGGPDDDVLVGGDGNDELDGGGGDDDLFGDDSPFGSDPGATGMDKLKGGSGDDGLFGGPMSDELDGGSGKDDLFGQASDDRLKGGSQDDTLVGGGDNDQLEGSSGDDKLFGDQLEPFQLTLFINFFGFDPSDTGADGNDRLFGGPDDDKLFGGGSDDELSGGSGTNVIDGEAGTDTCKSKAGDTVDNCEK